MRRHKEMMPFCFIDKTWPNSTSSQFHQYFTQTFFVQNFGAKNYKAVFWVRNFLAPKYQQKMRPLNVGKLTPVHSARSYA